MSLTKEEACMDQNIKKTGGAANNAAAQGIRTDGVKPQTPPPKTITSQAAAPTDQIAPQAKPRGGKPKQSWSKGEKSGGKGPRRTKKLSIIKRREARSVGYFLIPSLAGLLTFYIVPFLVVIYYSVVDSPINRQFVFLDNFINLLKNSAFKQDVYKRQSQSRDRE